MSDDAKKAALGAIAEADDWEDVPVAVKPAALDKNTLVDTIGMLESSGGQNREHPVVTAGVNKGTHSVSSYGLMPNTVYEFAKRDKNFQQTPVGKAILQTNGDPDAINQITADENNDRFIQTNLLDDQNKRLSTHLSPNDDPELANVYAHRRGVSGAIKALRDQSYLNDPYVQDYKAKKFERLQKFLRQPKS